MYLGAGDSGSGEQRDSRRLNPQRLDTLVGKILRIVPDLREHTTTSTVSENGRYRIPNDNPFSTVDGRAQGDLGVRAPQSASADLGRRSGAPRTPTLLAFNIGLVTWETVVVIRKGANYGYPLREGTQSMSSTNGMGPLPEDDMIPIQVSDTVTRGTVKPTYPVIQYPHTREAGGDAIANGFVYRGTLIPALRDKLVFGDITTGRIWYANRADVLAADDGNPTTVAPISRDGRRPASTHRGEVPRARREGEALPGFGAMVRSWPRGPPVRGRQRRRALHPDQERRHDQEGGRCQSRDGSRARRECSVAESRSERHQPASREPQESRGVHARVDRRREAGLRRQLRRLSREHGSRSRQGRHRRISIIEEQRRQAAAGSHRRSMGPRLERR